MRVRLHALLAALAVIAASCTDRDATDPVAPVAGLPASLEDDPPCDPETAITPCDDGPDDNVGQPVIFGDHDTGLRNAPGDPSPGAAGLWLGAGVANATCFTDRNRYAVDADADWLDDGCEHQIAWAFAPRMTFPIGEHCGDAEPYWAAKYFRGSVPVVRVAYLFSYYEDCGQAVAGFGGGHSGDSEFVIVDVVFNIFSRHWELQCAFFSAHYDTGNERSEWACGTNVEFYYRALTHPTVYVAYRKHANYRSLSQCDWTFWGVSEECRNSQWAMRVPVTPSHNLRSRFNPVNCVASERRYAGSGRTECYYIYRTQVVYDPEVGNSDVEGFHGWAPESEWHGQQAKQYYFVLMSDKFEQRHGSWGPGPTPYNWSFGVAIGGPTGGPENSTVTWTAQNQNGIAPFTYEWFVDGALVGTEASLTWSAGACGQQTSVSLRATDATSAVATASITFLASGPNGEFSCG